MKTRGQKRRAARGKAWRQGELFDRLAEDVIFNVIRYKLGRWARGFSGHQKGSFPCPVCEASRIHFYRTNRKPLIYAHCHTANCVSIEGI